MKVSVIIPTYNSNKTIGKTLKALKNSMYRDFETIVVDDCSRDNTVEIVKNYKCNLIKLRRNSGPAVVRNIGAKNAKGDILFFIDSDIILNKDAIKKTVDFYDNNKDAQCVIGMYSKNSANKGLFKEYMAYWKYYTWTNPLPKYFSFFIASVGTIKKNVFTELGGFSTKYKGADVEDYEFGHRLTKKYKIYFNHKIQGRHHFPSYKTCVKNYFKRSILWFELFKKRRRFDTGAATKSRGLSSLSTIFFVLSMFLGLISPYLLVIPFAFLAYFIISNIKFSGLLLREKGISFMLLAVPINFSLGVVISLGILASIFRSLAKWI